MSTATEYAALADDAGVVELARDVLRVGGPEAETYLQGQLSQDVVALAPGESVLSLLLEPQGKVDALLRVTRIGPDGFLLDTDAGFGAAALARLYRFKLRTRVEIETLDGWRCLAVRGPRAEEAVAGGGYAGPDTVLARFPWPGVAGVDLLGPEPVPPPGVTVCGAAAYEARRIEAGLPVMGRELDQGTIPEEAGVVGLSVSFSKGCYTGQELVARIDSRGGNVARRLRGLTAAGPVPAGAGVWVEENEAGAVTSTATRPGAEPAVVGLAYVKRAFTPPLEAEARWEGGRCAVSVHAL
jgi:folate-binding protein YgfZ